MINLVDLYYQINKGIFFTDKITKEAFSVYYNRQLPDVMWNYAAISNLSSLQKNYSEISQIFLRINKKTGFYLRDDQKNDICQLIEHKIMIKYPESWLRFDGDFETDSLEAKLVSTEKEQQDFLKLFSELNQKYYSDIARFINIFQKTFSAPNFSHFIICSEKQIVGLAVLGMYKDYALISNMQTLPEYSKPEWQSALLKACMQKFKQKQGKELYMQIIDNPPLEKWALKQGFRKMFNSYLLGK